MGPEPLQETRKSTRSTPARVLAAGVGLLLFVAVLWWASPAQILRKLSAFGWGLAVLIGLGGVSHLVKTLAWRYTFPARHRTLSMPRLLGVRLVGEAVGQFAIAGQLLGETTRAWMLRSALPTASSISGVIADRAMFTISSLLVALVGLILWVTPAGAGASRSSVGVLALLLTAPILLWLLALRNRWPFLSRAARWLSGLSPGVGSRLSTVAQVEDNLHGLYHDDRLNFLRILGLNMMSQGVSILEVYLILWLLGIDATLILAVKIEAITKFINLLGSVVPGNLGTSEAGNMLLLGSLRMGADNGVALALARRLRAWAWAMVGLAVLFFHAFVFDTVSPGGVSGERHRPSEADTQE